VSIEIPFGRMRSRQFLAIMIMLGLVIVIGCVLPRGYVRAKVSRRGPHSTRTGTAFCPRCFVSSVAKGGHAARPFQMKKEAAVGLLRGQRE
jgi:hypothetical protein